MPKTTRTSRTNSRTLTFDLDEAVRILVDPDPLFVANKMISSLNFSYLSGKRGIHVTGVLLASRQSVEQIAEQLGRDEEEMKKTLDATVKRRNDIVHRADRSQKILRRCTRNRLPMGEAGRGNDSSRLPRTGRSRDDSAQGTEAKGGGSAAAGGGVTWTKRFATSSATW